MWFKQTFRLSLLISFNPELHSCIRYSLTKDGLFCIAYVLFGCQKIILATEPLTDWSNAKRLVSKHEKTKQKSIDFLRVCDKRQLGIPQHMTRANYEILQHNAKVLHAMVSLIATCGKLYVVTQMTEVTLWLFCCIVLKVIRICNNISSFVRKMLRYQPPYSE